MFSTKKRIEQIKNRGDYVCPTLVSTSGETHKIGNLMAAFMWKQTENSESFSAKIYARKKCAPNKRYKFFSK